MLKAALGVMAEKVEIVCCCNAAVAAGGTLSEGVMLPAAIASPALMPLPAAVGRIETSDARFTDVKGAA